MTYFMILLSSLMIATSVQAQEVISIPEDSENVLDDFDPRDLRAEQILEEYDRLYEEETGMPAHMTSLFNVPGASCYRESCAVWVQVVKSAQLMYVFVNGVHTYTWKVSTGVNGSTPNFDTHPNGRIYDRYTSKKHPGGDYRGLGNMPYAVFFDGGYAIHGTTQGNFSKLGRPASHGCIRLHPDHAYIFNRMVRELGIRSVWITVQP